MKQIKKLAALALALSMVLSLAIPAAAAEITISVVDSASGAPVKGHTYEVYQIFVGDVAEDGQTLSNAAFGKNYAPAGKDVTAAMEELAAMTGEAAAAYLVENKTGEEFGILNDGNGHKLTAPTGYYLIIDVTEKLPENETRSAYILQALENVEIKSKHTTGPVVEKKIDDENDSTTAEDAIEWQDSADHDIGDLIDFKITTTLPASFTLFVDNKKPYPYTLHDTEEAGLTFQPDTVVVKIGETTLTKGTDYTVVSPTTDGHTFDIVFADLTKVAGAEAGAQIVVTYKSLLNEGAVLGNQGNVNEVFGEYKNFYDDEGPNYTPKDYVIAFTYKVNVDKIHQTGKDENNNPIYGELTGADFTLYKEVTNAQTVGAKTGKAIKEELAKTNPSIKADALDDDTYYIVAGVKSGAATGSTFSFNGVDDGNYVLVETTIPDGYNAWDSVAFTIAAGHNDTWNGEERTTILTSLTGGDLVSGEFKDTGIIDTDIENKAGTELPETGGMGTTLFYIFGAILMVGAAVLLVTKRRMNIAE